MIPRAAPVLASPVRAWRLDRARHAAAWDSGLGAASSGGRWNRKGTPAIYASLDAATAILEVAVHKGFAVLDTDPHVLTCLEITDPTLIHIVDPAAVPNPHWLHPGTPTPGQQIYGDTLLAAHGLVLLPSVVSRHSWNLVLEPGRSSTWTLVAQERFALDPRLAPSKP